MMPESQMDCLQCQEDSLTTSLEKFTLDTTDDLLGAAISNVSVCGGSVNLVERFTYLSSDIHVSGDSSYEVSRRIRRAWGVMRLLGRGVWHSRYLCKRTKVQVFRVLVLPVLLYDCETWTLSSDLRRRLDSFVTVSLWKILGYRWFDFVLLMESRMRHMTCIVKERQLRHYGHVEHFLEGDPARKILIVVDPSGWTRPRGRRCNTWLWQIEGHFQRVKLEYVSAWGFANRDPKLLCHVLNDNDDDDDPIFIQCETRGRCPVDPTGNYFRDGKTKTDFVLVWEVKNHSRKKRKPRSRSQDVDEDDAEDWDSKRASHGRWRDKYVRNLQSSGLLLEKEETVSEKKTIHYLKVSAPWEVLIYYAEELCLRAPLQEQPNPDLNSSARFLQTLCIPNMMAEFVPNKPVNYYTCAFRKSKVSKKSIGIIQKSDFEIFMNLNILDLPESENTIFEMDGLYELPGYEVAPEELNSRQVLYQFWARWSKWYKYQPLDHIRQYFGEKIAIYFAWLGFYTAWLLPAAVVGTIVFISGIVTMGTNTPAKEICSSEGLYLMCPLCDTCSAWNISDICSMTKLGYLFDHPGTVLFSVFMSFWAVTFLEYWKRKNATLAHHWDCMDFQENEERPRPEFVAMAPGMEQNPVTGAMEPYFPEKTRQSRILTGSMVIIFMLCIVMIFLVTVIMYRGIISMMMYHTGSSVLRTQAGNIANISSSMVNLALILLMGQVYTALAEQLTKWGKEQLACPAWRTHARKMKAWKQKRKIAKVRGTQISQESKRWEEDYELIECEGLFEEYLEMVLQFGFITIFVAAFPLAPLFALLNNWVEIRLDAQKFVCEYRRPVAERTQDIGVWFNILEALSHLSVIINAFLIAFTSDFLPRLLYQYKHDSNLHGYVNFSLAYAPSFSMDSNSSQCRYKAFRDESGNYTLFYWELLAVRLGFIIAFEHVVFFILRMIDWIVPDVPESLALKMKRERYLAKQALADNQDALLMVSRGSASSEEMLHVTTTPKHSDDVRASLSLSWLVAGGLWAARLCTNHYLPSSFLFSV
ncbi:ANO7 protein, partial [Polypterus senegalus]